MRYFFGAVMVTIAVLLAVNGYNARQAATKQRNAIQTQTIYLCSAVSALDPLVLAAASQIRANFQNGFYARAVRQGLMTLESVQRARATLQQYEAAHVILSQTQPCQEVTG